LQRITLIKHLTTARPFFAAQRDRGDLVFKPVVALDELDSSRTSSTTEAGSPLRPNREQRAMTYTDECAAKADGAHYQYTGVRNIAPFSGSADAAV
jgi:hypothetical protein